MRIFIWAVGIVGLTGCGETSTNYDALASKNLQCPADSHLEYLPWGKAGLRAVCLMEHGPIAIAENGHVVIEGTNSFGKQVGEWHWLDSTGKVVRKEHFADKEK